MSMEWVEVLWWIDRLNQMREEEASAIKKARG